MSVFLFLLCNIPGKSWEDRIHTQNKEITRNAIYILLTTVQLFKEDTRLSVVPSYTLTACCLSGICKKNIHCQC